MNTLLPELLLNDHQRMMALADELVEECSREGAGEAACFNRFRAFKALVSASTKAEEYTLFALLEEQENAFPDLRKFVLESYVTHDLIDLLLKEMGQAEELTDSFRAKLSVLRGMLARHLAEEQKEFLPQVQQRLREEQLKDLAVVYARERDTIFAKKSGLRKPASPIFNPRDMLTH